MKKLTSFFFAALLCANSFVAKADDASFVATWQFPIFFGFPWTAAPAPQEQKQIIAVTAPANFDAANCDFDAVWAGITSENAIANAVNNPASARGADDFTGAFKVIYDEDNIYVMLKYTDDDVTGTEKVEIMWAPDYKIQALEEGTFKDMAATNAIQHCRYAAFGGYKAAFSNVAFNAAMMINFNSSGAGDLNFDGTNALLTNNLAMKSYTAVGSKTIKVIYTLGFAVFTGAARPEFNTAIWSGLNSGKGITFDIKVNDPDADDAKDAQNNALSTAYWWNSTDNNGYAITNYSGFVGLAPNAVKNTKAKNSIFEKVTKNEIILSTAADITIMDALGKEVKSHKNANSIDISNLSVGLYIINAGGEIRKILK